jgi:very-short-patch-repair endonuclease
MDPAPLGPSGHLDGAKGIVIMQHRLKSSPARAAELARRASEMRQHSTASEAKLWQALRGRQLGATFRRQVPIGAYIVDFLAPSVHLIVEVDGGYHGQRRQADARRERWLGRAGYRVVRLEAELVTRDVASAVAVVAWCLS